MMLALSSVGLTFTTITPPISIINASLNLAPKNVTMIKCGSTYCNNQTQYCDQGKCYDDLFPNGIPPPTKINCSICAATQICDDYSCLTLCKTTSDCQMNYYHCINGICV
jgi:hypothetical protein